MYGNETQEEEVVVDNQQVEQLMVCGIPFHSYLGDGI